MTSVGLCSTSDVITVDQNCSTRGNNLPNDSQIRVIGSMEPDIGTEMPRNLSEKLAARFPPTTLPYSTENNACLIDAFSENSESEASPVEGQSLQQKDKKWRKREGENKKTKSIKT